MSDFHSKVDTINDFLGRPHQMWLMGAGASKESNIPLIEKITEKVTAALNSPILKKIAEDLGKSNAHIENILTYLGDLIAIAQRSASEKARLPDGSEVTFDVLNETHRNIIREIYQLVTRGIDPVTEDIADIEKPKITLSNHQSFIRALLKTIKHESNRRDVSFVTTNYDTLIEDALNLTGIPTRDGFVGGSVGVWNPELAFRQKLPADAVDVIKLHGSAEWVLHDKKVVRRRTNIADFNKDPETLIFPQATKYKLTQQDPFQQLFNEFRSKLNALAHCKGTLFTCGYSWGDEHINHEILRVLTAEGSQLHVVAFNENFPEALHEWSGDPEISEALGERMYIAHKNSVSHIDRSLIEASNSPLSWWKFSGLIEFLKTGDPVVAPKAGE